MLALTMQVELQCERIGGFFPFQIIWGLNFFIRMPSNYGLLKQYSITNIM